MTCNNPTGRARWTPAQDAFLRENYGPFTATQCAEKLGVTRNSVIGRAKRIGLCKPAEEAIRLARLTAVDRKRAHALNTAAVKREVARKMREAKAAKRAAAEAARLAAEAQPTPPSKAPFLSLVVCEPVRFVDLPARGCRWPVSLSVEEEATAETLFCGAPAFGEGEDFRPYCKAHTPASVRVRKPGEKPRTVNELIRSLRRMCA